MLLYDSFFLYQEIIFLCLFMFYQLLLMQCGVLIVLVNILMQCVCLYSYLYGYVLVMKKGQWLFCDVLCVQFDSVGYWYVDQVMEYGEYVMCGVLLDFFLMGSEQFYCFDFFDDEIDSLCLFDVDIQCMLEEVEVINLLFVYEFFIDKVVIEFFCSQWCDIFEVKCDVEYIYQQVSKGILFVGIEYWQLFFFSELLLLLFSYFFVNILVVNIGLLEISVECFQVDMLVCFENCGVDFMCLFLLLEVFWL